MKIVETKDRTTYTGEDAINLLNDLKAQYGKTDVNENSSEEEPDSKGWRKDTKLKEEKFFETNGNLDKKAGKFTQFKVILVILMAWVN